jgi:hypothetical protein
MRPKLYSGALLTLAGLTASGLIAVQAGTASAAGEDDAVHKRDDSLGQVVMTADDDDDDDDTRTRTRTRTNGNTNTDTRGTNTRTHRNGVSDDSRDTRTRDRTNDGPGRNNIDWSAHHTNDRSKNNTRGR